MELEEPFPAAVVVVWGTYYNFPAMSTMISTATFTFRIRKVLGYMVRTWLREQRAPERGIMRPSIHHLAGDLITIRGGTSHLSLEIKNNQLCENDSFMCAKQQTGKTVQFRTIP